MTMKWWDDIWLNEGFATWMANKPLAAWQPEWQVELDEAEETQTAVATDALRSTRADPHEGGDAGRDQRGVRRRSPTRRPRRVLRMIETYVGPELFRKGVAVVPAASTRLRNAAGEDFWTEMARVTGKPVDRIMKPFIEQPGVPVVTIDAQCQGGTDERGACTRNASLRSAARRRRARRCGRFLSASRRRCRNAAVQPARAAGPDRVAASLLGKRVRQCEWTRLLPLRIPAGEGHCALARTARSSLAPAERLTLLGDEWWMVRAGRTTLVCISISRRLSRRTIAPSVIEQIGRSLAMPTTPSSSRPMHRDSRIGCDADSVRN